MILGRKECIIVQEMVIPILTLIVQSASFVLQIMTYIEMHKKTTAPAQK